MRLDADDSVDERDAVGVEQHAMSVAGAVGCKHGFIVRPFDLRGHWQV